MDQTIELTRKLGLEQTPVFSGEQAGSLTLSIVEPSSNYHLPDALEQIMSIGADQLAPAPANTPTILDELGSALSTTPASAPFIAPSQKRKLAWIIHENIYRNGLAADGGFRRPQSPLGVPKSVLEPIQRPKRMNMQLNVAELIRQKCS